VKPFEVESQNFTTLVYSVFHDVGKSVLKMMGTLWKNNVVIAIAITFPEKRIGGFTFVPPLVLSVITIIC
jgi:hypothetical protein